MTICPFCGIADGHFEWCLEGYTWGTDPSGLQVAFVIEADQDLVSGYVEFAALSKARTGSFLEHLQVMLRGVADKQRQDCISATVDSVAETLGLSSDEVICLDADDVSRRLEAKHASVEPLRYIDMRGSPVRGVRIIQTLDDAQELFGPPASSSCYSDERPRHVARNQQRHEGAPNTRAERRRHARESNHKGCWPKGRGQR